MGNNYNKESNPSEKKKENKSQTIVKLNSSNKEKSQNSLIKNIKNEKIQSDNQISVILCNLH